MKNTSLLIIAVSFLISASLQARPRPIWDYGPPAKPPGQNISAPSAPSQPIQNRRTVRGQGKSPMEARMKAEWYLNGMQNPRIVRVLNGGNAQTGFYCDLTVVYGY